MTIPEFIFWSRTENRPYLPVAEKERLEVGRVQREERLTDHFYRNQPATVPETRRRRHRRVSERHH